MPAAEPGTVVVTVPGFDDTAVTVTMHHNPDTGVFDEPWAITVDGAPARIDLRTGPEAEPATFMCIPGAHITPQMLDEHAGIRNVADIHALTVTAA